MNTVYYALTRFLRDESGPTAVEYAVMLGFVLLACLAGIVLLGDNTLASFMNSSQRIDAAFNGSAGME